MRKRVRLRLALAFACAVVAFLVYALWPEEPHFNGRSLSEWIEASEGGPERAHAEEVLHARGKKDVPLLLKWMRMPLPTKPTLREQIDYGIWMVDDWLVEKKWFATRPIKLNTHYPRYYQYPGLAEWAFPELSPDGKAAAAPALVAMLAETNLSPVDGYVGTARTAATILNKLAPESIEPLITALASTNMQVFSLAVDALGEIGPQAGNAIPVLLARVKTIDPAVAVRIPPVLIHLGADPKQTLPLCRELLNRALSATNITSANTRYDIISAMRQIDPAAAKNAEDEVLESDRRRNSFPGPAK